MSRYQNPYDRRRRIPRETLAAVIIGVIVAFFIYLIVGAAVADHEQPQKNPPTTTSAEPEWPKTTRGSTVKPVVLADGTHCSVINTVGGAAISCDWTGPKDPATGVSPKTTRGGSVKLVTMPDGRPCAVVDTTAAPGISCGPIPVKVNP